MSFSSFKNDKESLNTTTIRSKSVYNASVTQEIEIIPEFFISHYKKNVSENLISQINDFKTCFVTATEEEWVV